MAEQRNPTDGMDQRPEPLSDRMITPERSVFGTRAPRPTGVGRHLIVVLVLSLIAIGFAVAFAEREAPVVKTSPATP